MTKTFHSDVLEASRRALVARREESERRQIVGYKNETPPRTCVNDEVHTLEVRNGKYGGFIVCAVCSLTMSLFVEGCDSENNRRLDLFRALSTWKTETTEAAIEKARRYPAIPAWKRNPVLNGDGGGGSTDDYYHSQGQFSYYGGFGS